MRLQSVGLWLSVLSIGCASGVALRPAKSCDGTNLEACQTSCTDGTARACYRLGWFYERGQGVDENPQKAIELYERACDKDFAVACRALGHVYWYDEVVDRRPKKAISYYERACSLGLTSACPTEAMLAEAEGRKPRPGVGLDASVSGEAGTDSGAPNGPESPSGPEAPSGPEVPGG